MRNDSIRIINAWQNNLKNVSIEIPKHQWTTVTGVSGSGKSTLIFDVLYSKAQKEYLESLSTYARRSFPKIGDVDVERIEGLSPCIVIDQLSFPNTPRSTVGTYTDLYTYIRLLFSRAGDSVMSSVAFSFNTAGGACPCCNGLGEAMVPDLDKLLQKNLSLNEGAICHRTWKVNSRYWNIIRAIDYFDMDKKLCDFSEEELNMLLYSPPFVYQNDEPGHVQTFSYEGIVNRLIKRKNDERGLTAVEYDDQFFTNGVCSECQGVRLNSVARAVRLNNGLTIGDCVNMELAELYDELTKLHGPVEDLLVPVLKKGIRNLLDVGLGYLTLNRSVNTLSGGEAQKIKLAKALGCSLTDMIYILDEPTGGMHPHDIHCISRILRNLVERGNTVITISHDKEIICSSDYLVDMGPSAGRNGGEVLYNGEVDGIFLCNKSVTAPYLSTGIPALRPAVRQPQGFIHMKDISDHNLKSVTVDIPKGVFTCITGVSGSGKSTLVEALLRLEPKVIIADQDHIGATARGNAATYTKIFDDIRKYFGKKTGRDAADFSFNSNGSCDYCNGLGYTVTDMHFIGDIHTPCEECNGRRYKKEILSCRVRTKNIADVLDMTAYEAIEYFEDDLSIVNRLKVLVEVGLDYIQLGQPLNTLSGGEMQRLKLADRIQEKGNIYVFDEPTRGLHFQDVDRLLRIFGRLAQNNNTIIVIEHNLRVVSQADHIIDMGPLGGKAGGRIVFEGTPLELIKCSKSLTGKCLSVAMAQN